MVTIFKAVVGDNADVVTVFTVTLANGTLRVSGNAEVAASLGIPTEPLILLDGETINPEEEPDYYLEKLPYAYYGSRFFAEFIA